MANIVKSDEQLAYECAQMQITLMAIKSSLVQWNHEIYAHRSDLEYLISDIEGHLDEHERLLKSWTGQVTDG